MKDGEDVVGNRRTQAGRCRSELDVATTSVAVG